MKIQSVKRIKLNKIGTVAAVLILCCISFTAGVDLTQKANSAGSSSALPVAKGGTGQNSLADVMGVGSAKKLATARTINGVAFDGTANVNIAAYYTVTPGITASNGYEYYEISLPEMVDVFDAIFSPSGIKAAQIEISTKQTVAIAKANLWFGRQYYSTSTFNATDFSYMLRLSDPARLYLRLKPDGVTNRGLYWSSSAKATTVTNITDVSQIDALELQQFNLFNSTPMATPTPAPSFPLPTPTTPTTP